MRATNRSSIVAALLAAGLPGGCSATADQASLVLLPFWLIGEGIAAALDNSPAGTTEVRIAGYCRDVSRDSAYALFTSSSSSSSYKPKCAPGDASITKAEFDSIVDRARAEWARDYCDDGDSPYRATGDSCEPGDTAMDRADWLALSRGHATREVI